MRNRTALIFLCAVILSASLSGAALAVEIIVDDQGSGFSRYGTPSYWKEAWIGYNGHMLYTYNGQSAIDNYARWQPNLSSAGSGTYTVSAYIPSNYADTTNATYTIFHNGITDTRAINQAIYSNQWVSLGEFYFSAAGNEYVQLVDKTGESYATKRVGFDAVKWFKAAATTYAITPNPATVSEGAGTLTFTITRSGGTPAETIYASTTQTEGYANNSDYIGFVNQTVSFTSGQTTRTVTVTILNDTTVESSETFGFIVQRNASDPITTYLAKSTFTITDNDPLAVILEVPYIHQCYDTNDNFVGSWACAPTSAVMILAYYGRISPHPMWVSSPSPGHYSDYGWYVSNEYTYGSHTFSIEHAEDTGCGQATGKGAWGYIWKDSSSSCISCGVITNLQEYLTFHDLTVFYDHYDEISARNLVQQEIDNNRPLIARTYLTGGGHYVVVVGYEIDASGNFWYKVNDTFGDKPYGDTCWGDYGIQQPVTYSYSQMGLNDTTRGLITVSPSTLIPSYIDGIDVSSNQGYISWPEVYNAGYSFAFARASWGDENPPTLIDDYFETNMVNGHAAGMLIGAYHFAYPEYTDPVSEAHHFLNVAGDYLIEGYLRPVLDLEDDPGFDSYPYRLGKEALSNWVHEWMNTVKNETGIEPIIYTSSDYANNYLNISINQYDLWIAHWTYNPNNPPNTGIWEDWDFWQYSDQGSVPGVSGYVDLDLFNGDMSRLNTFMISALLQGDINGNGKVDFEDLQILANQWLQPPSTPSADLAPSPLDNFVNFLDFAVLAGNWLAGVE